MNARNKGPARRRCRRRVRQLPVFWAAAANDTRCRSERKVVNRSFLVLAKTIGLFFCATAALTATEQTDLFVTGEEGYHTFRIPALLTTPKSVVLAFCKKRK